MASTSALILVDIQNDFLPGGALAVPTGDEVVPIAQAAIQRAKADGTHVVATQDLHPAGHRSFASQHPRHAVNDLIDLNGVQQVLWPDHCVEGTAGAEFAAALDPSTFDYICPKGRDREVDSYSGFFDNDRRHATGLSDWLRGRGITELTVLGLATDYCVKFTVLDALAEGFDTTVLQAGCRGIDLNRGDCDAALDAMRAAGATIL